MEEGFEMINSVSTSAVNLISSAQFKADDAAQRIASSSIPESNKVESSQFKSDDITKPLVDLKQAEFENAAAVKLLKSDNERMGTLFNAIA